tara:strand:- start:101 stop:532 length:432 start_codon:yes stop_codon:yes gene_type:complete
MRFFKLSLVLLIILSTNSHSENMLPLKKYLKNNQDFKDLSRTRYLLKRCTALHFFLSDNKFTAKDNNIRIRYEKDYNFFSMKLYKILNLENSDFTKLNKKVDNEILKYSKTYLRDGKKNLQKTGSSFKRNYILEDLKICSKIQ